MKYVSGPYFEPDFDPLLDRFGTPGYASALFLGKFFGSLAPNSVPDELGAVAAGLSSTMRPARTARS